MEETVKNVECVEPVEDAKPAQIEEKRPWKRNKRYIRTGTLVGCSFCNSVRGTMRVKDGKRMCEACYKLYMT